MQFFAGNGKKRVSTCFFVILSGYNLNFHSAEGVLKNSKKIKCFGKKCRFFDISLAEKCRFFDISPVFGDFLKCLFRDFKSLFFS